MLNNKGKKGTGSVIDRMISDFDHRIDEDTSVHLGNVTHTGARREWTPAIAHAEQNVTIEELLADDYYLGSFNLWPSIKEELEKIWHYRCDFNVMLIAKGVPQQRETIYALSIEHAERKAREKWSRIIDDLENEGVEYSFDIWRDRDIHSVIIECPKGTGKDFEMAMMIVILVREFLIQDREEFFKPYGLDLTTTISINCMNRTEDQAKKVTFKEVLPKFSTPFFTDYFPPQIDLKTVLEDARYYPGDLKFPQNVVIFPGTGTASSGLGYTVGSTVIDECNFLMKSASNKQSIIGADTYDAAEEIYQDAIQRHNSRFSRIVHGKEVCAGITIGISSSRTTKDFTQRKKIEALEDDGILYISSAYWERKPVTGLSGKTFFFDLASMSVVDPDNSLKIYQENVKKPLEDDEEIVI